MQNKSSSNPAFNDKVWERVMANRAHGPSTVPGAMTQGYATINGTIHKTVILLMCLVATAAISWSYAVELTATGLFMPILIVSAIIQLVLTFMIVRNPTRAQNFGIAYALIEGITLGALSFLFERLYTGIVIQAILGTSGVVLGMLIIYRAKIIKVTENFKIMVGAATFGILFLYIISMVMNMFSSSIPMIHEGTTFGIIFSLLVIGVAAFNLAIDFDFIEKCEEQKAPAHMEWYGAFGLMVTIIWLYIEILRLLAKTQRRK